MNSNYGVVGVFFFVMVWIGSYTLYVKPLPQGPQHKVKCKTNKTRNPPSVQFAGTPDQESVNILTTAPQPKATQKNATFIYSNVKVTSRLELVGKEPWYYAQREPAQRSYSQRIRVGCLFVGFMRDYDKMLKTCQEARPSWCRDPIKVKFYGGQERNILRPLDCDVFITTWHIGGKGRYHTQTYDMNDIIKPKQIMDAYGSRLAILHVQNYTQYGPIWKNMSRYMRNFTEAYPIERGDQMSNKMWKHRPTPRGFFRTNDYSQSYKHWVIVQLADTFPVKYDLYMRLRTDLRTSSRFLTLNGDTGSQRYWFRMTNDPKNHTIHPRRIHVHAPDISDFGYMGTPENIRYLSTVWTRLCLVLGRLTNMSMQMIMNDQADYNRVVWQHVFDEGWEVDFGFTYLQISRRYKETPESIRRRRG
eukprot:PhF_6_TR32142/c0_g2_i4/m.47618